MTYADKLKDPRWQKKRLEILQRDGFKCRSCGNEEETLHVHHLSADYSVDPWNHREDDMVTLCETCHSYLHNIYKKGTHPEIVSCVVNIYERWSTDNLKLTPIEEKKNVKKNWWDTEVTTEDDPFEREVTND